MIFSLSSFKKEVIICVYSRKWTQCVVIIHDEKNNTNWPANRPIDSFAWKLVLSTQIKYELRPSTNDSSHFLIISDRLSFVAVVFFFIFCLKDKTHWNERKRGHRTGYYTKMNMLSSRTRFIFFFIWDHPYTQYTHNANDEWSHRVYAAAAVSVSLSKTHITITNELYLEYSTVHQKIFVHWEGKKLTHAQMNS